MKTLLLPLFTILIMLNTSCEKDQPLQYGFSCPVDNHSKGLTVMAVDSRAESVFLEGIISVQSGALEIFLYNPQGEVVYTNCIIAPDQLNIREVFPAQPGFWKLKYISTQGIGSLDLQMKMQGIQ